MCKSYLGLGASSDPALEPRVLVLHGLDRLQGLDDLWRLRLLGIADHDLIINLKLQYEVYVIHSPN